MAVAVMACKLCHFGNGDLAFNTSSVLPSGVCLIECGKLASYLAVMRVVKTDPE